jgi:hypothetical protein
MLIDRQAVTGRPPVDAHAAAIGHAAVVGAVVGYVVVLAVVSGIVLASGATGLGIALAIGAYVAVWGGPGWGGMIAAQRCADRRVVCEAHVLDARVGTDVDEHPEQRPLVSAAPD